MRFSFDVRKLWQNLDYIQLHLKRWQFNTDKVYWERMWFFFFFNLASRDTPFVFAEVKNTTGSSIFWMISGMTAFNCECKVFGILDENYKMRQNQTLLYKFQGLTRMKISRRETLLVWTKINKQNVLRDSKTEKVQILGMIECHVLHTWQKLRVDSI